MSFAASLAKMGHVNASVQEVTQFISCGHPPLDHRVSGKYKDGGFPLGRIIEMFGPPSSGKTAIATGIMANAQKAGGLAIFRDHENSFDVGQGKALGLSDNPEQWVYSKPDTFEQSIQETINLLLHARGMEIKEDGSFAKTGEGFFPDDKPIVAVFDSLASMVPLSTIKDAAKRNMNDNTALARATSAHFPTLAKVAERTNALIIFLNQARTKIGVMYGDPTTSPGGNAPEFYASVRIKLGKSILKNKVSGEVLGQRIGCEVIKNKINRPFLKAEWDFLFQADGSGKLDVVGSVIDELVALKKIEQSGAWTTWDGKKWNSRPALVKHIEENNQMPQLMDLLAEAEIAVS